MILQVVGSVPGLQNAGVIWAEESTAFLLGFGLTQSIVDRRLFYLHGKSGLLLVVGTSVDDCKLVQPETMAAAFNGAWKKKYRGPPDADATANDFLVPKYVRATDGEKETLKIGCGKALVDLEEKPKDLMPRGGGGAHCAVPLPPAALRQLENGPGPDNARMPESVLSRARSILGLGGWIFCHARPGAMLGFVAIPRRVSPGRLTEYAWGRLIQWARYLVNTKELQLTMRRCPPESDAAFLSDSSSLNGPVPGSSCGGACMQFAMGDPAVAKTAMSGAIWTRCLVPPELGDSSAAAELIMASVAVKEAVAHLILATELRLGPLGSTPLYLDAPAVPHETAADQVSRERNYLAANWPSYKGPGPRARPRPRRSTRAATQPTS
mmetsp:Transcript_4068/g.9683  ORF Transcript_4068/g.9683 Transcript_4068/m.9683 type:complete len:381 (-) Transcript_4068:53-1195(-)